MERLVPKSTKKHRHEFNNFATYYHMLLSKQIYTNTLKQTNRKYFHQVTT